MVKTVLAIGDSKQDGGAAQLFNRTNAILRQNGLTVVEFTKDDFVGLAHWREKTFAEIKAAPWHFDKLLQLFSKMLKRIFKVSLFNLMDIIRHNYDPFLTAKLKRLLAENDIDVAHIHNIHGFLSTSLFKTLKKNRVPIIYQINDYYFYCNTYYGYLPIQKQPCRACLSGRSLPAYQNRCSQYYNAGNYRTEFLKRWLINLRNPWRHVSGVIGTSDTALDLASVQFSAQTFKKKIYNPMVLGEFKTKLATGTWILFYGSNLYLKGTDLFLKSLSFLRPGTKIAISLMHMTPEFEMQIRKICEQKALQLKMKNDLKWNAGLKEFVATEARCVVVPSVWWVTSENVVYEAMLLGKPVIVSDIGGNKELVDHMVTGIVFPHNSPEKLATSMQLLSRSARLASQMGRKAKQRGIRLFDESHFFSEWREIANQISRLPQ